MPLSLPSSKFALICDGEELEMHDVKQEGPNSIRAFVASEAGKQFRITYINNLLNTDLVFDLYVDGERIFRGYVRPGQPYQIFGIQKSITSVLPFKFQELELVDPDVENAPVVPEMGTIELRAFRCQALRIEAYQNRTTHGLHRGRVSERSKKAGWHHISTGGEVPSNVATLVHTDIFDPPNAPHATIKVFYRPRELLMAQGVIAGHVAGGLEVNDRKRAREDGLPGSSKRRTGSTLKNEDNSAARAQRIQALQAELNSLKTEQSGSSVKHELRSPSPIVVGGVAGEVIDLTLEDFED